MLQVGSLASQESCRCQRHPRNNRLQATQGMQPETLCCSEGLVQVVLGLRHLLHCSLCAWVRRAMGRGGGFDAAKHLVKGFEPDQECLLALKAGCASSVMKSEQTCACVQKMSETLLMASDLQLNTCCYAAARIL